MIKLEKLVVGAAKGRIYLKHDVYHPNEDKNVVLLYKKGTKFDNQANLSRLVIAGELYVLDNDYHKFYERGGK